MKFLILFMTALGLMAQSKVAGPLYLGSFTISTLPAAASYSGYLAVATDSLTAGTCTTNGGTATTLCRSNGSAWIPLGGGASITSFAELTECKITRTSATVLNIAACTVRIGEVFYTYAAATATLSGTVASNTATIRVDSAGVLTVVNPGAATVTCSAACTVSATIPVNSVLVGSATYASSNWDVGGIIDQRSIIGRDLVTAGPSGNVSITQNGAGLQEIEFTSAAGAAIGSSVWASRPACSGVTQSWNITDNPGLKSICDGATWTNFFQDVPVTLPAAAGSFTVVNGGTLTDAAGTVTFSKSTTGLGVALLAFPDTGASWDIRMAISAYGLNGTSAGTHECGLWITNGTTAGTHNAHGLEIANNTSFVSQFTRRSYTPINGSRVDEGLGAGSGYVTRPIWLRLTRSAGNVTAYTGDGTLWKSLQVDAPGFTATHYGIGCDPASSTEVVIRVVHLSLQ